ncbi:MAG: META domain-containing protein [bacterium]|nr:META domain-containing protein [bacterium]
MRRQAVGLLVVLVVVMACGRARVPSFAEHQWSLVELDGRAVGADVARVPYLTFHRDGRVSGFGGCNRLAGTYRVDRDSLTFGPLAATRMACLDAPDVETAFLAALGRVQRWTVADGRLALLTGDGTRLAVLVEAAAH